MHRALTESRSTPDSRGVDLLCSIVATFVVPISLALTTGLRVLTETEHRTRSVTTWVERTIKCWGS